MAFETGLTMGERLTSLFQPDTLIADQFLQTFRRLTHLQPEKRLMLAVLEDGVACFQKYVAARDGRGKRIFRETEEWVLEEPNEGLFSFANVCETLGFNADYLRRGLMSWKTAYLESRAPARVYQLTPLMEKESGRDEEPAAAEEALRKATGS
jgi:hypothetical protein